MILNTNMMSLNAQRRLNATNNAVQNSLEKLSSGYRINRASDDAAGLAITEKMKAQINGLNQASRNAQDGISLIQTAEGALDETHAILQRMRELAVQASSSGLEAQDRTSIGYEMDQLVEEVSKIAERTKFNNQNLLDGSFGLTIDATSTLPGAAGVAAVTLNGAKAGETYTVTQAVANQITLADSKGNTQIVSGLANTYTGVVNFDKLGVQIKVNALDTTGTGLNGLTVVTSAAGSASFQIGANAGETLSVNIGDMQATALGIDTIDLSSETNATAALGAVDTAINKVSDQRANLGAWQNRLDHTINNLNVASENLSAAESRIRDVDMAKEMSTFTKNQVLAQAGIAMLAQANQQPQAILKLLG